MNTLLIHKKGEKLFWHTHNNLPSTLFAISDFDISIDGNKFKITERNGSMRYEYDVTNVQVKNLANPNESFVSGEQLYNRLFQLNYIPFLGYNSGNTVTYVQENPIIGIGTITRTVNDFTFSVGFKWKINAIIYQNASPIVRTIYAATTGYFRIDIAVMDTNNDIIIIQGDEVDAIEAVQAPLTPENTVYLTSWFISGSTVNNPDEVYPGNIFVEKEEFVNIYLSDASGSITIDLDQKATKFILTDDATTEINGFNPSSEFLSEFLRPDHVISITNRSATPKTLKHLVGSWKMQFPDETDLTLPPNYRANFIVETHDGITFVYFNGMNKLGGSIGLQQVLENGASYTANGKTITITESWITFYDEETLSQMDIGFGYDHENKMILLNTPNVGDVTRVEFPLTETPEEVAYKSYVDTGLSDKVDKVTGKQLSTEDYTTAEKSKLAGIASGATANDTDANLLNRANHTGTQDISTITGLQTFLDGLQRNIIEDITDRSHTGSFSETIVSNQLISANALKTGTILELNSRINRTGTNASANIRYYISPNNNSLTGATQIGFTALTNTQSLPKFTRQFSINSSSVLRGLGGSVSAISDEVGTTVALLNLSLTLSNNYYLITTVQLNNTADTITQECIYLKSSR